VLNVLSGAEGIYLATWRANPTSTCTATASTTRVSTIRRGGRPSDGQLEEGLTFCPRRYTNIRPSNSPKSWRRSLRRAVPQPVLPRRFGGDRDGPDAGPAGDRPFQDHLLLGLLSRSGFACAGIGGEEHFHGESGPCCRRLPRGLPQLLPQPWGFTREEDVDAECLRQIEHVLQREPEMSAVIGERSRPPRHSVPTLLGGACAPSATVSGRCSFLTRLSRASAAPGKMFGLRALRDSGRARARQILGGGLLPFSGIVTHENTTPCRTAPSATTPREERALRPPRPWRRSRSSNPAAGEHSAKLGAYALQRLNAMKEAAPFDGGRGRPGLPHRHRPGQDRATKERRWTRPRSSCSNA